MLSTVGIQQQQVWTMENSNDKYIFMNHTSCTWNVMTFEKLGPGGAWKTLSMKDGLTQQTALMYLDRFFCHFVTSSRVWEKFLGRANQKREVHRYFSSKTWLIANTLNRRAHEILFAFELCE